MAYADYIESLATAQERVTAADLYWAWISWDLDTEWTEEIELESAIVQYIGIMAEVELGSTDYTDQDLANYRNAAKL